MPFLVGMFNLSWNWINWIHILECFPEAKRLYGHPPLRCTFPNSNSWLKHYRNSDTKHLPCFGCYLVLSFRVPSNSIQNRGYICTRIRNTETPPPNQITWQHLAGSYVLLSSVSFRYIFGIPPLILVLLPVASSDCELEGKSGEEYQNVIMVSLNDLVRDPLAFSHCNSSGKCDRCCRYAVLYSSFHL